MMKWYKIISLIGFIFILNLAWELFNSPFYVYSPDMNLSQHILMSSLAGSGLIISFLLAVSLKHNSIEWIDKPSITDYLIIIFLGLLTSLKIEMSALSAGSWVYTPLMPAIWGIGLIPLIQLFTIAILSLIITRKLNPIALQ